MTGPDHTRFADDSGAYLLGALAEEERVAFELHMEKCPDCRDDVEQLRLAAEALPRSVEQLTPPDRLRGSIMDAVRAEGDVRAAARRAPRACATGSPPSGSCGRRSPAPRSRSA